LGDHQLGDAFYSKLVDLDMRHCPRILEEVDVAASTDTHVVDDKATCEHWYTMW